MAAIIQKQPIHDPSIQKQQQDSNLTNHPNHNLKSEIRNLKSLRSAFTLTELLVVITIIAILASLTVAAARQALEASNRTAIILELQQLGTATEDFKNEFGAYPPNAMGNELGYTNNVMFNTIQSDFERMFRKAFPRHKEHDGLLKALVGNTGGNSLNGKPSELENGMRSAEALVFWLGGFSKDAKYPISGPGGPSYVPPVSGLPTDNEILEDRNLRYEFELGRFQPRDSNGAFTGNRFITYEDPRNNSIKRRINLWTYMPGKSTKPILYFDASRHSPGKYDPDLMKGSGSPVYGLKQLRAAFNTAGTPTVSDVVYVGGKKFQILHCGTDDEWGDFSRLGIKTASAENNASNVLVAPEGPFIGEIADTLGNFMPGTLEDKQE